MSHLFLGLFFEAMFGSRERAQVTLYSLLGLAGVGLLALAFDSLLTWFQPESLAFGCVGVVFLLVLVADISTRSEQARSTKNSDKP